MPTTVYDLIQKARGSFFLFLKIFNTRRILVISYCELVSNVIGEAEQESSHQFGSFCQLYIAERTLGTWECLAEYVLSMIGCFLLIYFPATSDPNSEGYLGAR